MKLNYKFGDGLNTSSQTFQPPMARREVTLEEAYGQFVGRLANFDNSFDEHTVLSQLAATYLEVSNLNRERVRLLDKYKSNYIIDVIVTQLCEDALSPEIGSDAILDVSSINENIQKEIEYLDELIDFNQLAKNVASEAIVYGEYYIRTEIEPKKGLTDIVEDVEYGSVVPLTKGGKIKRYMQADEAGRIHFKHRADFCGFIMDGYRHRIDFKNAFAYNIRDTKRNQAISKEVPRYIRLGRSLIYSILPKIKELELLEKLVPATKLAKLASGNLVGVTLNEKTEMKEAIKVVKEIENLINNRVGVDTDLGELTVEKIFNTAGTTKVLPLFGDKGRIERLDYKADEPDDLTGSATDVRKLILDSVGIPYSIVYGSDSENKQEVLRRYSRYLKKLKSIQRCISQGITQLIRIHLDNKDIDYDKDKDITVSFLNKLVEIDTLDELEHMDITISSLGNLRDYVQSLIVEDSPIKDCIDVDAYAEYIDDKLTTIGLSGLINEDKLEKLKIKLKDPQALSKEISPIDDYNNESIDDIDVKDKVDNEQV